MEVSRSFERIAFLQFLVAFFGTEPILGTLLQHVVDPVGVHRTRIYPDDANIVVQGMSAHCTGKRHEAGITRGPGNVVRVEHFPSVTDIIDDNPAAACFESRIDGAGQINVAIYFELPPGTPFGLIDVPKVSARDNTRGG